MIFEAPEIDFMLSPLRVWALNIHQLHTGTNWSSIGIETSLPIMYFNACSVVPKFGQLCPIVKTHQPDIVSIVESWLCEEIPDHEISTYPWLPAILQRS